jgi:hypothetical protein
MHCLLKKKKRQARADCVRPSGAPTSDIKKKMEWAIVGCKTNVMGLTWASDFIRPLYIKAGHASPQCSKKRQNCPPQFCYNFTENSGHNRLPAVGSLQPHGPTDFWFGVWVNLQATSNSLQTLRVSVLHPTQAPQTPPLGLFGLDQIKHRSWVQTCIRNSSTNIYTMSCKVQNEKVP